MSIIDQPVLEKANELANNSTPIIGKNNQYKEYYQNIIENRVKILTDTDFDKINNIVLEKEKSNPETVVKYINNG
ncbi:hypothetical protein K5V21_17325 [Clostridium sardiniense]|uniref:Uncharacterized protein n=1 Tax=Clostridium sardiniense TaxID=29369 RepID=A0ABS7L299_CLOSR|nr:hypothetical protein [Clostridium sardiniense]MBY0757195.1 hypothetical protein [Clostridium sardiniense]MDQ0461629.1 hypothetical protein [Clostridium sardiniense]